jgi:UDP-N-acetylglucosamine transferase subunit ALG13
MDLPQQYDCAIVLSGPEPQRSYLEDIVLKQLPGLAMPSAILVRGTREGRPLPAIKGLEVIDLATGSKLNRIMCASRMMICRSGYSTLLDLSVLRKPALLIATPGQPEQEYLAKELKRKGLFLHVPQSKIDLKKDLAEAQNFPGFTLDVPAPRLETILDQLLEELNINRK